MATPVPSEEAPAPPWVEAAVGDPAPPEFCPFDMLLPFMKATCPEVFCPLADASPFYVLIIYLKDFEILRFV